MKKYIFMVLGLGALTSLPSSAQAKLNVFACEPEWEALAKEIGGDLVDVKSATTAYQDVHHLRAKPSLLAAMRKADIVFCSGASLESGWLPILIKKAGSQDVQPETIGWVMASDYVEKLEIMLEGVDRSQGHIHPEGNPHVHLDPRNIEAIADVFVERLYMLDQENLKTYDANYKAFKSSWKEKLKEWHEKAAPLKGSKVVVYHNAWAYLFNWLEIDVVTTLEPKPGLPPTASHLEKVLQQIQGQNVKAILVAPYENKDAAEWLASKSGIKIIDLPFTVGGSEGASTLEGLFDETLNALLGAH